VETFYKYTNYTIHVIHENTVRNKLVPEKLHILGSFRNMFAIKISFRTVNYS
jgi:hypothetical protein